MFNKINRLAARFFLVAFLVGIAALARVGSASAAPAFAFPWDSSVQVRYTGGPHNAVSLNPCTIVSVVGASGIDFGMSQQEVLAMAGGTIKSVELNDSVRGNVVSVDHGGGWETQYFHLKSVDPSLSVGTPLIAQGRVLGISGNTGSGAGGQYHLHVDLRLNGQPASWNGAQVNGWTVRPMTKPGVPTDEFNYEGTLTKGTETNAQIHYPACDTSLTAAQVIKTSGSAGTVEAGDGQYLSSSNHRNTAASSCSTSGISLGQTVNGGLSTSDGRSPVRGSSFYCDRYTFSGNSGQQVSILLTSSSFDTFLYLLNSGGATITSNDDGGGGTNSRIPASSGCFSLPSSGTFTVEVTSYYTNSTGSYTLALSACSTATIPAAPGNPSAVATSSSTIQVSWQDSSNNETGFEVNDCCVSQYAGGNTQSYTWGGLAPGTYKCFHIRAYNSAGSSAWTNYACATTPASGGTRTTAIVDDQSSGFVRGGTAAYWHEAFIGYGGHMWWTYNRQSGVDNWGKWTPNLNGAGNYEVYVYIPSNYATTGNAGYRIHHNGVDDVRRPVNQMAYSNQWVSLGTYYFNDASDEYVFMGDETFETSSSRMIGFDAMQFVPR